MKHLGVLAVFLSIFGCTGPETPEPALVKIDESTVRLSATVRTIDDYVPVDGGVEFVLEDASGRTHRAHFPSMFTYPPPPPERGELYSFIQTLQPGDAVIITGPMVDSVITIVTITRR